MSAVAERTEGYRAAADTLPASVGDFVQLLKLRVMSLVVFTALAGMVVAPAGLHPVLAVISLIAIAVGAGAAGALNMWFDADIDAVMKRTRGRPIPAGRVSRDAAATFGLMLALGGVTLLGLAANWLAAGLLAFTIFFYAVVYTMVLKRRTAQNIVIGGAAGALPPVIGWAAMTGGIALEPAILFLVIFLWTPAHFWALALLTHEDYARAGVPMLPVTAGAASTRRQILVYTLLTVATAMLPWALGQAGAVYGVVAAIGGAAFARAAWRLWRIGEAPEGRRAAGRLFALSILYLFAIFAALMAGHLLAGAIG